MAHGSLYLFHVRKTVCNSAFVGKYGFTKDLARRTKEHARNFGPEPIYLVCNSAVAVAKMRDAEQWIMDELKHMRLKPMTCALYDVPRSNELLLVPWADIEWVGAKYKQAEVEFGII